MRELTEFDKFYMCTESVKSKGSHSIDCRLGLWGVTAPTIEQAVSEAKHYFLQYLADGEYSSIVGGMNVVETLLHNERKQ
ncbi:MAG TPA: hypothetical protein EYN67_12330 [Flavobacteriales bacterium]|nr:hypothetical protein [Methylococcaceae bacterium]HHZ96309.1 hypothetical protein [Flavobacteriales bacterium]